MKHAMQLIFAASPDAEGHHGRDAPLGRPDGAARRPYHTSLYCCRGIIRIGISLFLVFLAGLARVEAHAFLKRAEPAVGSTVQKSPGEVRIWFSEKLKPAVNTIQVFDASGQEVDKRDVHLDGSNQELLRVSLPPLQPGTYKVVWRAVSIDTHVTKGSFTFRIAH